MFTWMRFFGHVTTPGSDHQTGWTKLANFANHCNSPPKKTIEMDSFGGLTEGNPKMRGMWIYRDVKNPRRMFGRWTASAVQTKNKKWGSGANLRVLKTNRVPPNATCFSTFSKSIYFQALI